MTPDIEAALFNRWFNGEQDARQGFEYGLHLNQIYLMGQTLYRVNPQGEYALYYNNRAWRESAKVTNKELVGMERL